MMNLKGLMFSMSIPTSYLVIDHICSNDLLCFYNSVLLSVDMTTTLQHIDLHEYVHVTAIIYKPDN